jgi:hypothetical protein
MRLLEKFTMCLNQVIFYFVVILSRFFNPANFLKWRCEH